MEQDAGKRVFTATEAARVLRLGESKFRELRQSGAIRTVRVGRRVLVPATEVDRFLAGEGQPSIVTR